MEEKIKMEFLDTRRMVRQGGTLCVSLPKAFCDVNGIERRTPMDIFASGDGKHIIIRKAKPRVQG